MVIGNGQLANAFKLLKLEATVIFASGVSNSNCTDVKQFEREKRLLIDTLQNNKDKKIVYFSSCALSASDYHKNKYYIHKANMEETLKQYSSSYYIFRVPQLFGDLREHPTIINFIYNSIINDMKFKVYSDAYRYVISIEDVKILVEKYLEFGEQNATIDLANPYKYKVLEIVTIFEKLLDKKAIFEIINKEDKYTLNLISFISFVEEHGIDIEFGKQYLYKKLQEKIFIDRKIID